MGDQSKSSKKKKTINEYEYCKVCRINHNNGRQHNYFPRHVASLSSYLSRFRSKLEDVKFFLQNPISLLTDLSHANRIWCVFCDIEVIETGSSFACGNAINHLAGADHLKNLKSFLWKFGGKMDQLDSFTISEADLAKWEKKCKSLISGAASEGSGRLSIGPSNAMREIRYAIQNNLKSQALALLVLPLHISPLEHILRQTHGIQTTPQGAHTTSNLWVAMTKNGQGIASSVMEGLILIQES